eukprot:snap_masked-scaffold_47-processed-gene-0.6-mRNA-1 protein AED:1.00 eAED:1.00 QI:0/-1/0/0/-1/1/1/0/260
MNKIFWAMKTILFKEEKENDEYRKKLENKGHKPIFSKILHFEHIEEAHSKLSEVLVAKQSVKLLITSPRGSDFLNKFIENIEESQKEIMTVFCLSNETQRCLSGRVEILHGKSKNAAELARFCLEFSSVTDHSATNYVFLCGTEHRNTLPTIFAQEGVSLIKIPCYRSVPKLEPNVLTSLLHPGPRVWIFFSPVGAKFVLKQLLDKEGCIPDGIIFGAIGETTAAEINQFLSSQGIFPPEILIAEKPNPEGVVQALQSAE